MERRTEWRELTETFSNHGLEGAVRSKGGTHPASICRSIGGGQRTSEERPSAEAGFLGERQASVEQGVGGQNFSVWVAAVFIYPRIGIPVGTMEKERREGSGGRLSGGAEA